MRPTPAQTQARRQSVRSGPKEKRAKRGPSSMPSLEESVAQLVSRGFPRYQPVLSEQDKELRRQRAELEITKLETDMALSNIQLEKEAKELELLEQKRGADFEHKRIRLKKEAKELELLEQEC